MSEKDKGTDKPLDKMTAKELREMAIGLPGITGAHGMNKPELISAIKQAKGIPEETVMTKKTDDAKMATRYRRQISKLKKKTRRAA